jgi:hypothetical protein
VFFIYYVIVLLMSEAKMQYTEALKDRRAGIASSLGSSATFEEAKPDFYADARILSEDALEVFEDLKGQYPPYGLVDYVGNPLQNLKSATQPWHRLYSALGSTGHHIFEKAVPSVASCPYHQVLADRLGPTVPPLTPFDNNQRGLDTLRNVVTPGGVLNSPLFVSLIRRLPALQQLHGSLSDSETFARNSKSLLREPLAHPQQWATAFVYTLGDLRDLLTDNYLNNGLARVYSKVEQTSDGQERLAWAIPTEEFTIHREVTVADRTRGSETDHDGDHWATYPVGTKLKDIEVNEPLIGCPGDRLARAMWDRVVDVVVGEELWNKAT